MPIGAASYKQFCTYWGSPVQGGFGDIIFSAPVLLKCRWEDTTEEFVDKEGDRHGSRAIVWTYEKLEVGGYLAKEDQTGQTDPTALNESLVIQRSDEIPDLRGLNMERKSYL